MTDLGLNIEKKAIKDGYCLSFIAFLSSYLINLINKTLYYFSPSDEPFSGYGCRGPP